MVARVKVALMSMFVVLMGATNAFCVDDTNIASLFTGTGDLVAQIILALTTLMVAWIVLPFIRRAYRGIKSVVSS